MFPSLEARPLRTRGKDGSVTETTKLWLPPVATLASLAAVATFDAPSWVIDLAKLWGPTFLLLTAGFAGLLYYIPRSSVSDFVQAQKDQAVALGQISLTLTEITGQRDKLDRILANQEEMKLDLRVGAERFKRLEEGLLHG